MSSSWIRELLLIICSRELQLICLSFSWWQEGIESQAIDRVNRIGQKKNVHVYQLIAENTVESKVLEIQDRKKQLIKEVRCW